MGVPSIFTSTPIEALLQQSGLEVQSSLASIMVGTPMFMGAAATVFMIRSGRELVRSGLGQQEGSVTALNVVKAWAFVTVGWVLLGYQTSATVEIGPLEGNHQEAWSDLPGVAASPAYEALQHPSRALFSFHYINGAIEELTGVLQQAVIKTTQATDPGESVLGLMQLQATSLGAAHAPVASTFMDLAKNCSALEDAKIYSRGAAAKDLFDLGKPGCGTKWAAFEEEFDTARQAIIPATIETNHGDVLDRVMGLVGAGVDTDDEAVKNYFMSVVMENWIAEQAGRTANNSRRQTAATFSDGTGDMLAEAYMDGPFGEFLAYLTDAMPGTADPHAAAAKAEAANKFNEYADLIPTMRGFLHAMFAAFYPLVAFAVALGWTRPFMAWLAARFTLGLYMPAATLLYQMTDRLTQQSAMATNPDLAWVQTDEFVFGGAMLLESEISRIQTSYLMCEGAVFTGFLVGSAVLLRGGIQASSSGAAGIERGFGSARNGMLVLGSFGAAGASLAGRLRGAAAAGAASTVAVSQAPKRPVPTRLESPRPRSVRPVSPLGRRL